MSKLETRTFNAVELRADEQSISGKIPYGSKSVDMGGWHEVLKAGCFADTIRSGARVLSFWSHDQSRPLASTDSRTLELTDTASALQFRIHVPDTSWGRDALASVRSHVTKNCSFGFRCKRDSWKNKIRTIEAAELLEISPVSWAAYPETSVRQRGVTMPRMTEDIKKLLESRFKLLTEMRALHESENYDKEQYDRMEQDYEKLDHEIALRTREEEMKETFNEPIRPAPMKQERSGRYAEEPDPWQGRSMRIIPPGQYAKRSPLKAPTEIEDRSMGRLYSVGLYGLTDSEKMFFEQRRTLQVDADVHAGFVVVPETYVGQILHGLNDQVWMRANGTQLELKNANALTIPYEHTAIDDSNWTAEIKTGSEDGSMDFQALSLRPHPSAKRLIISRTLAQRAAGFQQYANDRLATKFGITEEKAFLTGDGGGKPIGVFTVASAGGLGITSDRDVSTGNSATEIKADNLIEVLHSLKAQYRKNAKWIFHRDAIKQIRKLKTGDGVYLLSPSLSADKPDTILGKEYFESEYAPSTFTTGLYVGLCGDLSYYWIATALNVEIQVLLELYAEQNCIGLIGRMEVDAAPILSEAFARVKLA
jgi:HK97 family phage major capsid protein/HK97 family phage prohead protease